MRLAQLPAQVPPGDPDFLGRCGDSLGVARDHARDRIANLPRRRLGLFGSRGNFGRHVVKIENG